MKILCLGDSPYIKTGFGIVNAVAVEALLAAGHELVILGGQDSLARERERVTYYPIAENTTDLLGWTRVPKIVADEKPDAVNIVGDPTMVVLWLLHDCVSSLPVVAYTPIEGAPLNYQWVASLKKAPNLRLATCTYYGQRVLHEAGIEASMAYHGVSPDFVQYDPERRSELRHNVGWADDMFVVMCVAQNVRRKQWPRLFEGIRLAAKKYPETYLYAHTAPFDNYWLGGWDLAQLADQMGVWGNVMFPPSHDKHNASIPLTGGSHPGLIDLYNMADAFVLPSQVEGFGLPLVEAMACGLPVVTTDYAAQAEVVGKAGVLLPVSDWEVNQSHAVYANVAPSDIADSIVRLQRSPEMRRQYSRRSLERAKLFFWSDYEDFLKGAFDAVAQEAHQV